MTDDVISEESPYIPQKAHRGIVTVPLTIMGAILDQLGGQVAVTREKQAFSTVESILYHTDPRDGAILLTVVHRKEKPVKTGSVYVRVGSQHEASVRQHTIEALNTTVVLDYDAQDNLIGVEVIDAVRAEWNGKTMPLPGSADG